MALSILSAYRRLASVMERRLPLWTLGGFVLGIFFFAVFPAAGAAVGAVVSGFLAAYAYLGPVAIFFILAPSLARIIRSPRPGSARFTVFAVFWLGLWRLAALIFAVVFTGLAFGLPWSGSAAGFLPSLDKTAHTLGRMMTHSPYFAAIYAAVAVVLISFVHDGIARGLEACANGIEKFGQALMPLFPLFMIAVGGYIAGLPHHLESGLDKDAAGMALHPLRVFGFALDPYGPAGMLRVYLAGALLTALCCALWKGLLIAVCKVLVRGFSLRQYYVEYWSRIYPLLWATASESLAAPLNLYLVKKHYPQIWPEVRRFVIGVGAFLDINGTMICTIVLTAVVASLLGIPLSWAQLGLCVPLVFLIGYGVPGIPGELLLFGLPLVQLLDLPPHASEAFLGIFLGLQLGLPDSFRTGTNSTDSCPLALLLNNIYARRHAGDKRPDDTEL